MMQHFFKQLYFFDGGSNIHKKVPVFEHCNISHFYKKDNKQYRKGRVVFSLN